MLAMPTIRQKEGIYHYGSENYLSRYEFAIAIAKNLNLDCKLINPIS